MHSFSVHHQVIRCAPLAAVLVCIITARDDSINSPPARSTPLCPPELTHAHPLDGCALRGTVLALAGNRSITVCVEGGGCLAEDNVSPLTGYVVRSERVGAQPSVRTEEFAASPCVVSGLENGGEYTVSAAAVNARGTGPFFTVIKNIVPGGERGMQSCVVSYEPGPWW
jgi:hypothetical protein